MITEREKKWLEENSSWIEDEKTDLETFGNRAFTSLSNDSGMKLSIVFAEARGGHSFYVKKIYPYTGWYRYSLYIKQPNNKLFYLDSTEPVDHPLDNQEILTSIDEQVRRLGLKSQKLNSLYKNLQVSR
jgi:hypothetical protein